MLPCQIQKFANPHLSFFCKNKNHHFPGNINTLWCCAGSLLLQSDYSIIKPDVLKYIVMTTNTKNYHPVSAEEAVSVIQSGNKVFVHSVAASPQILVKAMAERAQELRNVEVFQLHTEGHAPPTPMNQ